MRENKHVASWAALALVLTTTVALAEGDDDMLAVGEPFVEFELAAHDGTTVAGADLAGKPYLLFFYPKADTPG
jgi:cytochrome oxidase Cu insertion factor (SCO1/SenC/PrrC family)